MKTEAQKIVQAMSPAQKLRADPNGCTFPPGN